MSICRNLEVSGSAEMLSGRPPDHRFTFEVVRRNRPFRETPIHPSWQLSFNHKVLCYLHFGANQRFMQRATLCQISKTSNTMHSLRLADQSTAGENQFEKCIQWKCRPLMSEDAAFNQLALKVVKQISITIIIFTQHVQWFGGFKCQMLRLYCC